MDMKKILVVQSRTDESRIAGEQSHFRAALGATADISFLSALDERLAWSTPDEFLKGIDGVIFGGSSDFDFHGGRPAKDPARLMSLILLSRTRNIISYTLAQRLPLLGVCFGHQMVAERHGGEVDNDAAQSKFGSHEISLTEEGARDPVFGHLPKSFFAQYAHKDSVTTLPSGATLLAQSPSCAFSALRYADKAYTVQFHPEVLKFSDIPGVTRESPEASRIIPLWAQYALA